MRKLRVTVEGEHHRTTNSVYNFNKGNYNGLKVELLNND